MGNLLIAHRNLLLAAGGVALVAAFQKGPDILAAFGSEFEFEPSPVDGFRQIAGGSSSTGSFDPFVGLDRDKVAIPAELVATVERNLCSTLFEDTGTGDVPVASFSDYNCPYCRILTRDLGRIAQEGGVTVSWHELPLLGETSIAAAKAALAAKRQGAYTEFHERLLRTAFVTTPEFLRLIADDIGVDYEQLRRDIDSPKIEDELERSKALAQIFRFSATPAMVVGRTVVIGVVGEARLRSLIELERQEGRVERCFV